MANNLFNNLHILISDLNDIYESENWFKTGPNFQTFPTLFDIKKDHWQELRQNFIDSVSQYSGAIPVRIEAWCYANFVGQPQEEWPLWHTHEKIMWPELGVKRKVCGVMYLTPSEKGTVFLKENKYVYLPADVGVWNFFDPQEVHSPPKWDPSNKTNRYCIAADAGFI